MSKTSPRLIARRAGAAVLAAVAMFVMPARALTVAADSSLTEAVRLLARDFESRNSGPPVTLELGASGALLEQIARGAAIDVLASADDETVTQGVQRRLLLPDTGTPFAANTLVLVVPASRALPIRRLSDLSRAEVERIAMGREATVPAGRYAREAINAQRLWPSVQRKVMIVADVREVLEMVASGRADAGFVFATDAAVAAERVRVVETLSTSTPIRYRAAAAAPGSGSPGAARQTNQVRAQAFLAYLRSEEARTLLKGLGFGMP